MCFSLNEWILEQEVHQRLDIDSCLISRRYLNRASVLQSVADLSAHSQNCQNFPALCFYRGVWMFIKPEKLPGFFISFHILSMPSLTHSFTSFSSPLFNLIQSILFGARYLVKFSTVRPLQGSSLPLIIRSNLTRGERAKQENTCSFCLAESIYGNIGTH